MVFKIYRKEYPAICFDTIKIDVPFISASYQEYLVVILVNVG